MKKGDRLFVYGTLRPSGSNSRALEGRAQHLGTTRIAGRLYGLGWFPGIKLVGSGDPAPTDMVEGDLFEITDDGLPSSLDSYEGYPSLYDRQVVPTEDGRDAWVYTYNGDVSEDRRIESGVWQS